MRPRSGLNRRVALALGAVLDAHDLDGAAPDYDALVLPRHRRDWVLAGPRRDRRGQDELSPVHLKVGAEVGDEPGVDDPACEADTYASSAGILG